MKQEIVSLDIALKEHRHDFVCNTSAQIMTFLESLGFTFDEVLDGLTNYAFLNVKDVDTVCYLSCATLSARKALEVKDVTP